MSDLELLELAAKAAGIEYDVDASKPNPVSKAFWGLWLVIHGEPSEYQRRNWNPLTDDGDALRLAVKLSLCITNWPKNDPPDSMVGFVASGEYASNWYETHNGDPCKSTRRAIVCAAAEIGKAMP